MKKLSFYLISVVTILLMGNISYRPQAAVIPGNFVEPPSILSEMPTNMVGYFKNLKENFGYNEIGSCGYIAIGMLLSYYDTFYNDDTIPEQYDAISSGNNFYNMKYNSPGVRREPVINASSEAAYYTAIAQYQNTHFQAYLLSIGQGLGYSSGLADDETEDILNYYITEENSLIEDMYTISLMRNNSGMIRQYVIDCIQNGKPVLLTSSQYDIPEFGHVFIAYDYDEEEDIIYGHMGWEANETYVDIEAEGFITLDMAVSLEYEGIHKCSDNYEVYGISSCPCGNIETHDHYASSSEKYMTIPLDDYAHRHYCYCGYYQNTSHNYVYLINKGYYKCNDCLHISTKPVAIHLLLIKKDEEE